MYVAYTHQNETIVTGTISIVQFDLQYAMEAIDKQKWVLF